MLRLSLYHRCHAQKEGEHKQAGGFLASTPALKRGWARGKAGRHNHGTERQHPTITLLTAHSEADIMTVWSVPPLASQKGERGGAL